MKFKKKNISLETQMKLSWVIPSIVSNITGVSIERAKFAFFRDGVHSHNTILDIVNDHANGGIMALNVLVAGMHLPGCLDPQSGTPVGDVFASTIPTVDGWLTVIWDNRVCDLLMQGIRDEDLAAL